VVCLYARHEIGANKGVIAGGEDHLHSRTCEPATLAGH